MIIEDFPYPKLLTLFPNSVIADMVDYIKIIPNKKLCFFVPKSPSSNVKGIYVFCSNTIINELRKKLKSIKVVYNTYKETQPCLFMNEMSTNFNADLKWLARWSQRSNIKAK